MPVLKRLFASALAAAIAAASLPALGDTPRPSASAPMPSITAPESAEQSATPAPASDVTQEIPAVLHVPVPVDQEEDSSWASYAALGAAILMLALLWFMRRGRRNKKLEEIRNAQEELWNPVTVVPFGTRDSAVKTEEAGLKAVTDTVDAVMAAEKEASTGSSGIHEAADNAAKSIAAIRGGLRSADESLPPARPELPKPEKKEDPLDPKTAYREMLASQLKLARDFLSRGAVDEARELATDVAKGGVAELSTEAKKFLDELPPAVKKERGV